MHDAVEFVDTGGRVFRLAGGCCWRGECQFGELGAIQAAVGIQDLSPKVADHLVVDGLARTHEFVRDVVGLDQMRAQGYKHFSDGGFAGGDSAG